jgi:hypothetical protein
VAQLQTNMQKVPGAKERNAFFNDNFVDQEVGESKREVLGVSGLTYRDVQENPFLLDELVTYLLVNKNKRGYDSYIEIVTRLITEVDYLDNNLRALTKGRRGYIKYGDIEIDKSLIREWRKQIKNYYLL